MSDLIDRQEAIDALKNDMASLDHIIQGMSGYDVRLDAYVSQRNQVNCDIDTISNLPPARPEPCEDAVSRKAAIDGLNDAVHEHNITDFDAVATILALPPVTPKQQEYHEIGYRECADAVLKMWMDNVLTDGEHNRIIDKLNAKWAISEGDAE